MHRHIHSLAVALALASGFGNPVAAQVPGDRGISPRDHRIRIRAEAYAAAQETMFFWRDAWERRDADAFDRYYDDAPSLRMPDGVVARGRKDVLELLAEWATTSSPMELSYVDFESDGDLAVLVGRFVFTRGDERYDDVVTTLLRRDGQSWRIRMQIFGAGK